MIRDEDLVQVRSADELQESMTVVIKRCPHHHKTCSGIVLKRVTAFGLHETRAGVQEKCLSSSLFLTTHTERSSCGCRTIAEGRLFRLKDLDAADELRREKRADRPLRVTERVR